MKKLIFCCLVVLMGSCKDDDKTVEPEQDYAPEFAGNYETTTVVPNTVFKQSWEATVSEKNKLAIVYIKNTEVTVAGTKVTLTQEYDLVDVKTSSKDIMEINETVSVKQSNGLPLQQKVQGIGTKVVNSDGKPQINITVKLTDSSTGSSTEEYLEFKKK
ncbi:hypothetical protein [Dyadobacter luticola]|uniref:Lipocalin-like domain-containing protein n=1 Tax=Dyadobacter luticola TaxID=1979387 RepID=A0A5R9KT84_9BACT|nr:hypothetical protein [Dyadobacter luticola]TLU99505.1 hypothetical protein FEN17_23395 [Dyadobacter luticola]